MFVVDAALEIVGCPANEINGEVLLRTALCCPVVNL